MGYLFVHNWRCLYMIGNIVSLLKSSTQDEFSVRSRIIILSHGAGMFLTV